MFLFQVQFLKMTLYLSFPFCKNSWARYDSLATGVTNSHQ